MQGQYNMRSPAVKRLMREAQELREPTEQFYAQPLDDNLFEWHFTIRGPGDSEFEGGVYHGRIILPPEYPMKPPSIIMLTPNGRFEVHKKICLSISGHHPESWQPSWSIRTAMLAIIGFMPTHGSGAIGSLDYTPEERKRLAKRTKDWRCPNCGRVSDVLLPVTDASKATNQEAKELASQINFQGEKESKAEDKNSSGDTKPAPEQTPASPNSGSPEPASPAPSPLPPSSQMSNPFAPRGFPGPMHMPMAVSPGMLSMMTAMAAQQAAGPRTAGPRAPLQFWPQYFRPPVSPPRGDPAARNMQMFWPPGFGAMMPQQQQQQQNSAASAAVTSATSVPNTPTSSAQLPSTSSANPATKQTATDESTSKPGSSSDTSDPLTLASATVSPAASLPTESPSSSLSVSSTSSSTSTTSTSVTSTASSEACTEVTPTAGVTTSPLAGVTMSPAAGVTTTPAGGATATPATGTAASPAAGVTTSPAAEVMATPTAEVTATPAAGIRHRTTTPQHHVNTTPQPARLPQQQSDNLVVTGLIVIIGLALLALLLRRLYILYLHNVALFPDDEL